MDAKSDKVIVFVYGTLKRGFGNNVLLQRGGAEYLGTARTVPGYTLYSCGAFPAMVQSEGAAGVKGELFRVDRDVVDRSLDRLEGVPYLYVRHDTPVESVELVDGVEADVPETVVAYLYNRPLHPRQPLTGEEWL